MISAILTRLWDDGFGSGVALRAPQLAFDETQPEVQPSKILFGCVLRCLSSGGHLTCCSSLVSPGLLSLSCSRGRMSSVQSHDKDQSDLLALHFHWSKDSLDGVGR